MDPKPINVLLIEDNPGDVRLIRELLADRGGPAIVLEAAARLADGLERLATGGIDVVLLDLSLPDSSGLDTFLQTRAQAPKLPVVLVTGLDDESLAVKAVQEGAQDYLVKGQVDGRGLVRSLHYAIERARRALAEERLRAAELESLTARQIQQKLFPAAAPQLDRLDIGGASYPAEATGGDYFDFIPLPDDTLGIAIGDVSGHGFGPALLMAEMRAYLRALTLTQSDVGAIVALVNQALASDTEGERFATLFFARLDPRSRSLVYASAGHTPGYILNPAGTVKAVLPSTGRPLGIEPGGDFAAAPAIRLVAGECLLLFTDGIPEACSPNETLFGPGRILEIVRGNLAEPAQEIVSRLYRSVREFCCHGTQCDDMSVIVVKVGA